MPAHLRLELIAIVIALAAVQSVFGVGLLVFGTPTLLLLGLPFAQVLAYLLPCSIVISGLQIRAGGGLTLDPLRRKFLLITAPLVIAGTAFILAWGTTLNVRVLVGVMLLVTGVIRFMDPVRDRAEALIRRRLSLFLAGLGIVHGLSNLGGGILALIVASSETDKGEIRRQIAFAYGLMAILQLTTLVVTSGLHVVPLLWLVLPASAALTFTVVGERIFLATGRDAYQVGLTGLILGFGFVLLLT